MKKTIMSLIYEVKHCFAHMNVYGRDDENVIEEYTDKGIRLLEALDDVISRDASNAEVITQNVNEKTGWVYLSTGELPPELSDVLFTTIAGQVFEGFLQKKDVSNPYMTADGKIGFKEFPDGGHWYRYHFRDLLEMRLVVAWQYKPAPAEYDRKKR